MPSPAPTRNVALVDGLLDAAGVGARLAERDDVRTGLVALLGALAPAAALAIRAATPRQTDTVQEREPPYGKNS